MNQQAKGPLILSIGEPMIEFNQNAEQTERYLQGFGGDTSNFCVAVARQGARVAYVTRLGDDVFGKAFMSLWQTEGVDTSGVVIDPNSHTGVYFVTHSEAGHAFSYLRARSAASLIRPEALPLALLDEAAYLHVSGITQAISTSACDTVFAAMDRARGNGTKIAYDPNFRPKLWPLARAKAIVEATLPFADYFLPSLEDAQALTGIEDADAIADYYLGRGVPTVCLKLGSRGVLLATSAERQQLTGYTVNTVDATGAGDCFDGSFLARIAQGDTPLDALRYANAAAALTTTGFGAVAPIPYPDAIREKMHS